MTHVLVCPTLGEKFWSSSYAILELVGHFYCVIVIKHSMSLRRMICERDLQKVLNKGLC